MNYHGNGKMHLWDDNVYLEIYGYIVWMNYYFYDCLFLFYKLYD